MRPRHCLLLGLALAFSVACAQASTIPPDPAVTVLDALPNGPIQGLTFSLTFPNDFATSTVTFNNVTYSPFFGVNGSGQVWQNLLVTFPTQPNVTCDPGQIFLACQVIGNTILFSGGPGIPINFEFTFAVSNWAQGTTFNVQANVPEPATLGLLGTGLGALLSGRFLRKRVPAQKSA